MALDEKLNEPASIKKRPYITTDLGNISRRLLKLWWLFIIVGVLAGLSGYFYALTKKPTYKSSLTFALDDGDGAGIGNFLNLASQFGISVGGGKDIFAGDNILEIMKSRRMLEKVLLSIDTFNNKPYTLIEYFLELDDDWRSKEQLKNIHFPVGLSKPSYSYRQDSLLYAVGQKFIDEYIVAQRPDRKLSIYQVSITSPDEKFTKDFTDRIVSETNNFYIEIRTKKAKETLDVLEGRVASMKGNLNTSIENRAAVQDVNINPAFSAAQVPVMRQQANIQVYGAAYGEMFKNLEMARFQYLNEIPLMQIIDGADYPMIKIKFGKLKGAILFAVLAELLVLTIIGLRGIFRNK
ncbi:MAG: Wzz/FepE/Etk N-terminal domain-containing protein [Bacteroidota bacterium]|nr:Wzz/FepE/Etk N-terminal domain-containing protein [Bacteroidota bacterium]